MRRQKTRNQSLLLLLHLEAKTKIVDHGQCGIS